MMSNLKVPATAGGVPSGPGPAAAPAAGRDPFRDFASESEVPLHSMRAKLAACHFLLSPRGDPGEEILNAVRTLVAEAYASCDGVIAHHALAFVVSREMAR